MFVPIERMLERVTRDREDSDTAYFAALLYLGELVVKTSVAGLLASVIDEREGHRYRLEHRLVRADGLGEWGQCLDDILTGPASQYLSDAARDLQAEFTMRHKQSADNWVRRSADYLMNASRLIEPDLADLPARPQLRDWFSRFVWLRNRTRGHGAPSAELVAHVCTPLHDSLAEIVTNCQLFTLPWAYLHRNLSGKYRVITVGNDPSPFAHLKSARDIEAPNGLYLHLDRPLRVPLIETDVDLTDFFYPNGAFTDRRYELMSYATGNHSYADSAPFLQSPAPLPASETQGLESFDVIGQTLVNLPPPPRGYIRRQLLEDELQAALVDDRHPVVTLVGRGGIGKTSVALQVLTRLAKTEGAFDTIVWFSSRDIDLLPSGWKLVAPHALALDDFAAQFVALMTPAERLLKDFRATEFLAETLFATRGDRTLFAFDNFETVRSPMDVYRWIDDRIRLPNKVLITTRMRQFKADYPVEVGGMSRDEFSELVDSVAGGLGIRSLVNRAYEDSLYRESDGHPYVVKMLLGEVARTGRTGSVERVLASREDILVALFERTFASLSPAAQRVFLTLANWRSVVPTLALEAALLRPSNDRFDVRGAVDLLVQSSLVEAVVSSADGEEFVTVPLAASVFGQRELAVSPLKSAVDVDTAYLRTFGASQAADVPRGLKPRVDRLMQAITESRAAGRSVEDHIKLLEFVARHYAPARLSLADLAHESGDNVRAIAMVRQYLQDRPADYHAWVRLARLYEAQVDYVGEIGASLELAAIPTAPFGALSDAANRFNFLFGKKLIEVDSDEKREMARRLLRLLDTRSSQAQADDFARMGWLALHLRDLPAAERYAKRGLTIDGANPHCVNVLASMKGNRRRGSQSDAS